MNAITERLVHTMKTELIKSKYIDVSAGSEKLMCVTKGRLDKALDQLIREGYSVVTIREKGSGKPAFRILCRQDDRAFKDILKQRKVLMKNERK